MNTKAFFTESGSPNVLDFESNTLYYINNINRTRFQAASNILFLPLTVQTIVFLKSMYFS